MGRVGGLMLAPVDEFINDSNLTVPAVYTPAGGDAVNVNVILDASPNELGLGNVDISSRDIFVYGSEDDFSSAAQGDTLQISGTTYYIKNIDDDKSAMYQIYLTEDEI